MKRTGFSRDTVELKLGTLSINYKEGNSYCSPCLHFVLPLSSPDSFVVAKCLWLSGCCCGKTEQL